MNRIIMNSMRGLVQQERDTNPDPINEKRPSERDAAHPSYLEHPLSPSL